MGFDSNGVKLLFKAKQLDVNFDKVITIGRQRLILKEKDMQQLIVDAGFSNNECENIFNNNSYSEPFLKLLGAKITDSIDVSDYEGATVVHNLNFPVSDNLKNKYTLVIDGGCLEHVFNFPVAIKNCMDLIQKNGYYIGITPTNNFFGHGFYQFSPELYYRIFSQSNGFQFVKMYFYIDKKKSPIYEVLDPLNINQRIIMVNAYPSYLFVIAKKIEEKEVFSQMPQESDYDYNNCNEKDCVKTAVNTVNKKINLFGLIKLFIPSFIKKWGVLIYRPAGNSNPQFIRKEQLTFTNKK